MSKKNQVGRRRDTDRTNTTSDKSALTTLTLFKRTLRNIDRILLNIEYKNRQQAFDSIIGFVFENQQDFYNYFNKKLK